MDRLATDPMLALADGVALADAPIRPEWIISGTPRARSARLFESSDRESSTWLWDCSAGTFHWYFDIDETIYVVGGAVEISWRGGSMRLKPGDSMHFPTGAATLWRVETSVRKIAFLRRPPPVLLSLPLRATRRVIAMARQAVFGQRGQPASELA